VPLAISALFAPEAHCRKSRPIGPTCQFGLYSSKKDGRPLCSPVRAAPSPIRYTTTSPAHERRRGEAILGLFPASSRGFPVRGPEGFGRIQIRQPTGPKPTAHRWHEISQRGMRSCEFGKPRRGCRGDDRGRCDRGILRIPAFLTDCGNPTIDYTDSSQSLLAVFLMLNGKGTQLLPTSEFSRREESYIRYA